MVKVFGHRNADLRGGAFNRNRICGALLVLAWVVVGGLAVSCSSQKALRSAAGAHAVPSLSYEDSRKYDYFFLEATRQREKGEYAAALSLYEHCLNINPYAAASMYELAQMYLYLGQADRARNLLEQAVKLQPDNFWYRETLGAYYRSTREFKKAIEVYEQMSLQFPARSELLMVLLDLYGQQKDYAQVIHTLDRLEVKEGKSEMLSMEKFRNYLQMDDKENAFKEIESLSKEYPNDMRYRVMLGDSYLDNGLPEEAYGIFQQVLAEEPGNVMAQVSLLSFYERQGQDSLALVQQDSLLMNPKLDSEMRINLMRRIIMQAEQRGKDSTYVLQLFDKLLLEPQEDASLTTLCYGYMQHKRMSDEHTRPILEKILQIEPDNTAARYNLLMVAVRKNDYHEAVQICTPAIQYNPEELPFYYYLGISHFQTGNEAAALSVLRKGVGQITPQSDRTLVSDLFSMIGDLSHTAGEKDAAFAAYDSALVYNPDNIMVLNNYAYFLSLEKRHLDKAEEMSFRTVKAEPKNNTYLDTYAWILFEKERYAEARIYIDEAMKNGGDESATIVEHCGDIYYLTGETDAALEYWKKASLMEHESKTLLKKIRLKRYIKE